MDSLSVANIFYSVLFLSCIYLTRIIFNRKPFPLNSPHLIQDENNVPYLGSMNFFNKRWEFFEESARKSESGNFSFRLANLRVIGLTGLKGREYFFNSKNSFQAGYSVLFGGVKNEANSHVIENRKDAELYDDNPAFNKRFIPLMKKERLEKALDGLVGDVVTRLDELGDEGVTNPFESIVSIVFQLSMRVVGCVEIASDRQLLDKLLVLYQKFESSSTPTTLLFPWLPGQSKIRRNLVGAQMYYIFKKIVDERKRTGRTEEDPLQTLIDRGDDPVEIITFVIGGLSAALINTGPIAAYVLCHLALHPSYLSKVFTEIKEVASKYSSPDVPLIEQLLSIPLTAWETELPILDLCIKESIRLHVAGCALRMNTSGKSTVIDSTGEAIGDGVLVTYHIGDVHYDENIYKDPLVFDPSRYLPDRAEDKKVPFAFVGWGAGRHPCLGIKFAKIELGIIVANFISRFDYSLVDKAGNSIDKMPEINLNSHQIAYPNPPVHLKYKLKGKVDV